jgi:hypothetical protein
MAPWFLTSANHGSSQYTNTSAVLKAYIWHVKQLVLSFSLSIPMACFAQNVVLSEDFNSGIPATWALFNNDGLTPHANVAQFTQAWITAADPDTTTGDLSAQSTSWYDPAGTSSDYLITPKTTLGAFGNYLYWQGRSQDASFADSYLILASTTDSLTASFTDTLMVVDEETPYWTSHSLCLDSAGLTGQPVFIAFLNNSTDRFILHLDNVAITANDPVSVAEHTLKQPAVYPNPAADWLAVPGQGEYHLFAADGRLVRTMHAPCTISCNQLPNGMYYLRHVQTQSSQCLIVSH